MSMERINDLLVGNLREVFVPFADGAEEGGGHDDADFGFVFEFVYGVGGRDGDGDDDFSRAFSFYIVDGDFHRETGRDAVVDDDGGLAAEVERTSALAISIPSSLRLFFFCEYFVFKPFFVHESSFGFVEDAVTGNVDGANRILLVSRRANLARDDEVEGEVEFPRDFFCNNNASARNGEDDRIGASHIRKFFCKEEARFNPIFKNFHDIISVP